MRPRRVIVAALLICPIVAQAESLQVLDVWRPITPQPRAVLDVGDDDGRHALVVVLGQQSLALLQADAGPRGYRELARLREGVLNGPPLIRHFDVTGDGRDEIVVADLHRLIVLDAATLHVQAAVQHGCSVGDLGFGDVDGDGEADIVVGCHGYLQLRHRSTLALTGAVAIDDLGQFGVGDVQGDARAEIVTTAGVAFEITRNGADLSAAPVWQVDTGPFDIVRLADATGDGKREVITASRFGGVDLHRVATSPGSQRLLDAQIVEGVEVGDLTGNGDVGIVARIASPRQIVGIGFNGVERWRVTRDALGTAWVAPLLVNGGNALAWGNGLSITVEPIAGGAGEGFSTQHSWSTPVASTVVPGHDPLRLAVLTTRAVDLFSAPGLGPLAGSGSEWLLPAWPAHAFGMTVVPRPADSGEAVAVLGITGDATTPEHRMARAWFVDTGGNLTRQLDLAVDAIPMTARARAGAGAPDRVVALWRDHPVSETTRLVVSDLGTGATVWQSAWFPSTDHPLIVDDIDGDGIAEIVVVAGGHALVFVPELGVQPIASFDGVLGAAVLRRSADGTSDLYLARAGGRIDVHPARVGAAARSVGVGADLDRFAVARLVNGVELLAHVDPFGSVMVRSARSGRLLASVQPQAVYLPGSSIEFLASSEPDAIEVLISGQDVVVLRYASEVLFVDGFEG